MCQCPWTLKVTLWTTGKSRAGVVRGPRDEEACRRCIRDSTTSPRCCSCRITNSSQQFFWPLGRTFDPTFPPSVSAVGELCAPGGATTNGPDATTPPVICQNSGGGVAYKDPARLPPPGLCPTVSVSVSVSLPHPTSLHLS